jgi:hypothetical protein
VRWREAGESIVHKGPDVAEDRSYVPRSDEVVLTLGEAIVVIGIRNLENLYRTSGGFGRTGDETYAVSRSAWAFRLAFRWVTNTPMSAAAAPIRALNVADQSIGSAFPG